MDQGPWKLKVPISKKDPHLECEYLSSKTRLPWGDEALHLFLHQFLGHREATWPISLERVMASPHKGTPTSWGIILPKCRAERGREDSTARFGCYLDGQLELLVFPLQLLCFRQRAGIDQAGVEHRLPIADPSQDLGSRDDSTGEWPFCARPFSQRACYLLPTVEDRTGRVWIIKISLNLPHTLCHKVLILSTNLIPSFIFSFLPLSLLNPRLLSCLI